jgi:hypothetical protein
LFSGLISSDEAIATLGGAGIPNHLRDSIFRLVENQAIEAEEQERALAEARGESSRSRRQYDDHDHDEEDVSRVRVVGEGDASGDEDIEGDADKVVDVSPHLSSAFQKRTRADSRKREDRVKNKLMIRIYRSNLNYRTSQTLLFSTETQQRGGQRVGSN